MEYRLLIDLDVIRILDSLPKKLRNRLLDQIEAIRSFPTQYSEYYTQDNIGRRIEICISCSWAIHYWIDVADRHVKVLSLKTAKP